MKSLSKLIVTLVPVAVIAAQRNAIETAQLDDRVVYAIPVATNRVTTISFPGPIAAIDAAGVTTDPHMAGQFQLAHSRGSAFFSVRALASKASANVNVRWGKNTYVFQLEESGQPVLSFILDAKPASGGANHAPVVSSTRLLALLDKAKVFPLLKQQHPETVAAVDFVTFDKKPSLSEFDDYQIQIEESFRFNPEDTLVFHLRLKNKTENPIHYRPDSFSLRTGTRIYQQSISDAAGLIPPKGETTAYFAVTGTPDGGRNELSLKNEFTVLVERIPPLPGPASTNQPPQLP